MLEEEPFDFGLVLNEFQIVSPPNRICANLHKKDAAGRLRFFFVRCVRMHIPFSAGVLKCRCFPGKESKTQAIAFQKEVFT